LLRKRLLNAPLALISGRRDAGLETVDPNDEYPIVLMPTALAGIPPNCLAPEGGNGPADVPRAHRCFVRLTVFGCDWGGRIPTTSAKFGWWNWFSPYVAGVTGGACPNELRSRPKKKTPPRDATALMVKPDRFSNGPLDLAETLENEELYAPVLCPR